MRLPETLRMARRTEWREVAPETFEGLGQRMLGTDVREYSLLELRRIEFAAGNAAGDAGA